MSPMKAEVRRRQEEEITIKRARAMRKTFSVLLALALFTVAACQKTQPNFAPEAERPPSGLTYTATESPPPSLFGARTPATAPTSQLAPVLSVNDKRNLGEFTAGADLDGLSHRALTDEWGITRSTETRLNGGPPILEALRTSIEQAIRMAVQQRKPGQVEVPVDADQDGDVESWVYFANDAPRFVERDRLHTGCHDLRLEILGEERHTAALQGWTREPPLPLEITFERTLAAEDLFDWAAAAQAGEAGSEHRDRNAVALFPALNGQLTQIAERSSDNTFAERIFHYVAEANRLYPGYIKQLRENQVLQKELASSKGRTVQHLRLTSDPLHEPGFSRDDVVSIRFYRHSSLDKNEACDADCHLEQGRVTRIDVAQHRFVLLGRFWARIRDDARTQITRAYLETGYYDYRAGNCYAAFAKFQRGVTAANVIDDFRSGPGGTLQKFEGELEEKWNATSGDIPAHVLLTLAIGLGLGYDQATLSSMFALASLAEQRGDSAQAIHLYALTTRFAEKFGHAEHTARILSQMSDVYRRMGNYDRALECLFESLDLESTVAHAQDVTRIVEMNRTRKNDLLDSNRAKEIYSYGMAHKRANRLATIAVLYGGLGDRAKAQAYLAEAERLLTRLGNGYMQADLLNLRAKWDLEDGKWQLALDRASRALQIVREEQERQQTKEKDMGAELQEAKFDPLALGHQTLARHWMTIVDPNGVMDAPLHVAISSRAPVWCYHAVNRALTAEILHQRARAGGAADAAADLRESQRLLEEALALYERADDMAGGLVTRIRMANLAYEHKNYDSAMKLAGAAQRAAELAHLFEPTWRALAIQGAASRALNRMEPARDYYEQAATHIESVRAALTSEPARRGFFASKLIVYEELADLYLAAGQMEKAWQCMERAKARTLLDLVAGQSLEVKGPAVTRLTANRPLLLQSLHRGLRPDQGNLALLDQERDEFRRGTFDPAADEVLSLTTVRPVDLAEVQKVLRPDDLLIEYFVSLNQLLIAVVTHTELTVIPVPDCGYVKIRDDVAALRAALENAGQPYEGLAQGLYDRLLKPVLADHAGPTHLCIIPGGPLHYLPFEALLQPNGKFVIEDYDVSYAASASALVYSLHRGGDTGASVGKTVVVAEPRPRAAVAPLVGAALEGLRIYNAARQPRGLLTGEGATETKLLAELPSAKYFHFAGHAQLSEASPMRAALLCSEDVDNDGRLEVREIFGLDLRHGELAVLSACQTRLGEWSRGDEIVGLERAFLRAGIPTVVASLWKVDDAATSVLMEEFYRGLWKGKLPLGEALRRAKLSVLVSPTLLIERDAELQGQLARRAVDFSAAAPLPDSGRFSEKTSRSHPAHWAAFVLSGNWR